MRDFARKIVERYETIERLRKQDEQNRKERIPPAMPQIPD